MRKVNPLWFLMLAQIGLILYGFYRLTLTRLNVRWFEVVWVIVGPVILMSFFGIYTYYNIKNAYKEPSEVRTSDRCPVCGAFVYSHPNTITEIYLDGKYMYFDSLKDMLKFIKDMDFYISYRKLNIKDKNIKSIYTKDFQTKQWIDGKKAFYVNIDDDIYAFSSLESAKDFATLNNIQEIKTFDKLLT